MNLSELICADTSEWTDEEDNVGEASKTWLNAPLAAKEYSSSEEDRETLEYFSEIFKYV